MKRLRRFCHLLLGEKISVTDLSKHFGKVETDNHGITAHGVWQSGISAANPLEPIGRLLRRVWTAATGQQVSPLGLAVFRVCYSTILLCEVVEMFKFRHLIFDAIPYIVTNDISFGPVLIAWVVALVCLILGLFTRTATVVNYVMTLLTFSTFHEFEYHMDYIYTGTNLLLIFLPISRRFSVDALRGRLANAGGTRTAAESPTVSMGYYYAVNFVCIGLIYFDSSFYKLASPMWTDGLGFWKPASFPQNTWLNLAGYLDFRFAALFAGYLTLAFEVVFIFLMWSRIFRPILFFVGVLLHIGITIVFPIPWFGLAVTSVYITMLPPHWFEFVFNSVKRLVTREPMTEGFVDSNRSASPDTSTQRDWNLIATAGLVGAMTVSQAMVTLLSPGATTICNMFGLQGFQRRMSSVAIEYRSLFRTTFGVTPHPVFMDSHFDGYDYVFAIIHVDSEGNEKWLPLITSDGRADRYNTGRQFVYWSWRVCGPNMTRRGFSNGLRKFTAFWVHQQANASLDDAHFKILVKDVDSTLRWEEGFYETQQAKPWRLAGHASWKNGAFTLQIGNTNHSETTRSD